MPRGRGGRDEPSDRRGRYGGDRDRDYERPSDRDRDQGRHRRDDRDGDRDRRYRSRSRDRGDRDREGHATIETVEAIADETTAVTEIGGGTTIGADGMTRTRGRRDDVMRTDLLVCS